MTKGFVTIKPLFLNLPSDFALLQELITLLYVYTEGPDARSQMVVDNGILPQVFKCIGMPDKMVKRYSIGVIGNITGCAHPIASAVYHSDQFMEQLVSELVGSGEEKVIRFCLWVLKNIICGGGSFSVSILFELNALRRVSELVSGGGVCGGG